MLGIPSCLGTTMTVKQSDENTYYSTLPLMFWPSVLFGCVVWKLALFLSLIYLHVYVFYILAI